ncbi:hypothetical protein [uncultured Brevundimonas sp.]|uniref:hypothetical protein n=1 Tax=uncultured Brevundimonas sp. TaxID=213418 RepID=UPI00261195E2|nr:hypothetical protein [uncultured Brevundimonas sp.]
MKSLAQRFRRRLAPVVSVAAMFAASPALADWVKYESPHFILYSSGSRREAREMLTELEKFDTVLRLFMGQSPDTEVYRKLPIYLVTDRGLRTIAPSIGNRVAGFYTSSDEDIYAVATRNEDFHTLKHEYAHHFMMANFSFPYPAWFVEGFAEYYAPTRFEHDITKIGMPNDNRAMALSYLSWMSMSELLSNRPLASTRNGDSYYPLAWLLAHWFLGDAGRRDQLQTYLREIAGGATSVAAFETATGLTPTQLRGTLRRYMNGRIPYVGLRTVYPSFEVTATPLPASADELLLLGQQLKSGGTEEQRQRTLQEVRTKAARFPDDPLAQVILAHAELHNARAPETAVSILEKLLEAHPHHVEALQYMARAKMQLADDSDDQATEIRLRQEAQNYLARAYAADDADFITMLLMSENRRTSPGYPSDNDVAILEIAFTLAPQLAEVRYYLAAALLEKGRNAEAISIIEPLVNNPHGENAAARALLLKARGQTEADAEAEAEAIRRQGEQEGDGSEGDGQTGDAPAN